ncbi:unnamed protein product, partial [Musa acuminata subsp. burmannicoides]
QDPLLFHLLKKITAKILNSELLTEPVTAGSLKKTTGDARKLPEIVAEAGKEATETCKRL